MYIVELFHFDGSGSCSLFVLSGTLTTGINGNFNVNSFLVNVADWVS